MPTNDELRWFDNIYAVDIDGNQNAIVRNLATSSNATTDFQDTSDSQSDNLDLLGDTQNDQFKDAANSNAILYYYRKLSDDSGVIVSSGSSGQGPYYLYTNNNYNSNTILSTSSAAYNLVCYVAGTRIRTRRGDVAVEDLKVGDLAKTSSGAERPIHWIGHRTVRCQGRPDHLPVRIAAHAFGEGRPDRDLLVSPAHAIAVDVLGEVLIPAGRLINGTTITQAETEQVTYWHVELASHDILLAEGLPAESYLDCGNRHFFTNAEATDLRAVPDARPDGPHPFCRPFHEAGPLVDLVRARLQDRAEALGWRKVEETFGELHLVADGHVIRPDVEGLTARFVLPADARDVRLVSATGVPAHLLTGSTDDRRLGLPLAALTIDDGLTGARNVPLDDARIGEGFHPVEGGTRWTDGSATLPADLWADCRGTLFLRVSLSGPGLPRWIAPGETARATDLTKLERTA